MSNYRLLFKELKDNFNQTELEALAFEIGYGPGDVFSQPGNLNRMSQDLQEFSRRRGLEQELLQAVHEARSFLDLTPYGGPAPAPEKPKATKPVKQQQPKTQADTLSQKKVFISYKWNDPSEDLVNDLVPALEEKGIEIIRDKEDLGFKGLIKEFMQEIGRGETIILVISDGYLHSENCMYELVQIYEQSKYSGEAFYDRVMPVVLPDAQIYDPLDRLDYLDYWSEKQEKLVERTRRAKGLQNMQSINEAINLYDQIRDTIDHLMDMLGNMNTLTARMHRDSGFQELFDAIHQRLTGQT
ncbi:MAG: toll/interleukin-1 receptor domain-containing protein [Chloroflexi bacterium]|nr:toll/interleukin-1 receptor domain-containing protein [Chloroflexota bacterium]